MTWTTPDDPWCAGRTLANTEPGHALRLGLPYAFLFELFAWRQPSLVGQIAAAPDQVLLGALGQVSRTTRTIASLLTDSAHVGALDLVYISGASAQLAAADNADAIVDALNVDGLIILAGDIQWGESIWSQQLLGKYRGFHGAWSTPMTVLAPKSSQSWSSLLCEESTNSMSVAYKTAAVLDDAQQESESLQNQLHVASTEIWSLQQEIEALHSAVAVAAANSIDQPSAQRPRTLSARLKRRISERPR
jgi:hypothetical protein